MLLDDVRRSLNRMVQQNADARVRAAAGFLMMAYPDPREAKLTAAMIQGWEPEFTAAVQRRIDRAYAIMTSMREGGWTIDYSKLKSYHSRLVRSGMPPVVTGEARW